MARADCKRGLALLGVIIGVPSALALTRLIGGMLYGVSSIDPTTYAAVIVMLVTSALLASYLPARRACGVDPIVALRAEQLSIRQLANQFVPRRSSGP